MKEFINFVCTDSTELFFSKLRSAGLNYNMPNFFTNSYCARGGGGGGGGAHFILEKKHNYWRGMQSKV